MDTKRLILFMILSFSILMSWDAWERQHQPPVTKSPVIAGAVTDAALPSASNKTSVATPVGTEVFSLTKGERIHVKTDLVEATIDTTGGDVRRLELIKHHATEDQSKNFVLLDDSAPTPHLYIAQSGLIGAGLPNHKTVFTSQAKDYALVEGNDKLEVRLSWSDANKVQVDKIYTFHRGSYVIDVDYEIKNGSGAAIDTSAYYQLLHDSESNKSSAIMPTFTGAAYFTEADKYKKLKFDDMQKTNLSKNATDGWIGIVQHYFASAWIPKSGVTREYRTKQLGEHLFAASVVVPVGNVQAGASTSFGARLFAGPQEQKHLKEVAPGLEYVVDYGWLTIFASPLFWVLSEIQKLVHNWGVAIILLTVLLKAAFYPLSAAGYKNMAHMRKLAPRLQQMKERFGDDKAKMQQAMMELYKTEKINPMGGCLPVLVQIPVFIAFYWMLLGTIEMRQAPFMLWITDLSAPDTLFGTVLGMPIGLLPILMGLTMILQTSLNPTPPDPIQAKVMKIMPVVFSVFFFFFPAGLVLYWLVNNILSIAQQWSINRMIEGGQKGVSA
ncbi:MAG: membrane protein insertase YidC [Methylophilaceae bacterium]